MVDGGSCSDRCTYRVSIARCWSFFALSFVLGLYQVYIWVYVWASNRSNRRRLVAGLFFVFLQLHKADVIGGLPCVTPTSECLLRRETLYLTYTAVPLCRRPEMLGPFLGFLLARER